MTEKGTTMAELFETLGVGTYVELRKRVGEPLSEEKIRRVSAKGTLNHTYAECEEPFRCDGEHRRTYEREQAKRRRQRQQQAAARAEAARAATARIRKAAKAAR